jgi:hypothetical protein
LATLKELMQKLVVRLLNFAEERHRKLLSQGRTAFEARNENQFFAARTLSIAFAELVALSRFSDVIADYPADQKAVMDKLGA